MEKELIALAPKNQHQMVIWYLYYWKSFSLAEIINDSMFYKFQTRLSEIESEHNLTIAERTKKKFTNKFNHKSTYNIYEKCVSDEKLIELFYKY